MEQEERGHGFPVDAPRAEGGQDLGRQRLQFRGTSLFRQ